MLTVLIHGADDPAALAQTLAPLVAGAVEGILRDVVVLDARGDDVRRVADHAGCRLAASADVLAKVASLKGEWVMLLRAGERLPADWIERFVRHSSAPKGATVARLPDPTRQGLLDLFRARGGAILARRDYLAGKGDIDIAMLLRRLRPRLLRS